MPSRDEPIGQSISVLRRGRLLSITDFWTRARSTAAALPSVMREGTTFSIPAISLIAPTRCPCLMMKSSLR